MTEGTRQPEWERLWSVFHEVRRAPEEQRAALLQQLCAHDDALCREIEALLATEQQADGMEPGDLFDDGDALRLDLLEAARSGEQLGRYTVVGKLGEGGAGSVYRARRTDGELEQEVAIKVLRIDATTPDMLERFELERQILARLDHPNIARVLDAGGRGADRPFVVLELVDGLPIDRYCRSHRLGVGATLRIFLAVCGAVSYAHRNLVVHRDLKPSNILVEADGTPKLLDFGIAKLMEGDVAQTATAARMLTPRYASPEQLGSGAVTTASDVYSLGVVLYELLVGRSPYGDDDSNPVELARRILEHDPERPSTVARAENPACDEHGTPLGVADRRRLDRDLDAIVLKALAKEPARRYANVDELAADLRRFLDGQPVEARPDSLLYRLGKLARRHRAATAATLALFLVLVGATVSTSLLSLRLADAVESERAQRLEAQQTSRFLVELFQAADPDRSDRELTARQVLRDGARRIESRDLAPVVRAEVGHTMVTALLHLSALDEAEEVLEQTLEPLGRELGGIEPARVRLHRAQLLALRSDRPAALAELRLGLAELEALPDSAPSERARRLELQLRAQLSTQLFMTGERAEGLAEIEGVVEAARGAEDVPALLDAIERLGFALRDNGDLERAEQLLRRGLEIHHDLGQGPTLASARLQEQLGLVLSDRDRLQEARDLLEGAIAEQERVLGEGSPRIHYNNLGVLLHRLGEHARARDAYERALENARAFYGPDSPDLATSSISGGWLLHDLGAFEEAERHYREALRITLAAAGDRAQNLIPIYNNLGLVRLDLGDPEGARPFLERGVELIQETFGPEHVALGFLLTNQGRLEHEVGHDLKAERLYREALRIRRAGLPAGHSDLALTLTDLGALLCGQHRFEEGEALVQEGLEIRRVKHRAIDWRIAVSENELGWCYQLQGRRDEARPLLEGSVERIVAQRGERDPRARAARQRLAAVRGP